MQDDSARSARCVHAVVVTFHPPHDDLAQLVQAILADVERVWVVDNTPGGSEHDLESERVVVMALGENRGLAAGLNIGIRAALAEGATHVLLSDQDSLPGTGMAARLLDTMEEVERNGAKVGAVGPLFVDIETGIAHPFQVDLPRRCFYGLRRPDAAQPVIEVLTLITSGSLVKAEALLDTGAMREDFFIDHVDIEWCHRARARGWRLFGTSRVQMRQHLGKSTFRAWRLGWRQENAYSSTRVYYRVRNFLVLCRESGIPFCWKIRNGLYWLWFVASHGIFGQERLASLRMAANGLRDGLRGRMGPLRSGSDLS